jgi:replicative DNA helicase
MNDSDQYVQGVVLGAILRDPTIAAGIFARISTQDFDPPYREVAEAIHALRLEQTPITALAVVDLMTRRGTLRTIGAADVIALVGHIGDPDYGTDVLVRRARLRRLWTTAVETQTWTEQTDADPHAIAETLRAKAQGIIDGVEAEGDLTTPTLGEFLSREDPDYSWVIPGLLERGDRLILTGSEGLGKSVLQRQLAVCAAAGVHPFNHRKVAPVRVLLVDCENGPTKLRRALRGLVDQARRFGDDPSMNMWIEAIPQGLDLTKPDDEMWLVRTVAALQPDLLLTGPIYRLHAANPNDEEPARKVTQVLDRCRSAANCAIVTEAHAGHGYGGLERPIRPTGSSLWLRWPEFGYGLRATADFDPSRRVVDFMPWRGDREERDWPKRIKAGGLWPWIEDRDSMVGAA